MAGSIATTFANSSHEEVLAAKRHKRHKIKPDWWFTDFVSYVPFVAKKKFGERLLNFCRSPSYYEGEGFSQRVG